MHNRHPIPSETSNPTRPKFRTSKCYYLPPPFFFLLAKILILISTHSTQPKDRPQAAAPRCSVLDHWHTRQDHWDSSSPASRCSLAVADPEVEVEDASLVGVVVAAAVAGRMHAVWWLAARSSVVLAEGRNTAGAQAERRGRRRRGCSLSLVGFESVLGRSLGGSLLLSWVVGSLACCCRASGDRFGIGVLLGGWRRGCTLTAGVGCCRKFGIGGVAGGGLREIDGWASWSAVGVMG